MRRKYRPSTPTSPTYAPMHTAGRTRWEGIKRWTVGLVAAILLSALQSTLFARIPLPLLPPASPSLTLLLTLSAAFFLGEREGAVAGLLAGFFAEAAGGEGIMILPLVYTLCGYLVGWLSRDRLAHNLPSFAVWTLVAGVWEQTARLVRAAVTTHSLPPARIITEDMLPHLLLTLLFAPAIYGVAKLLSRLFERT